MYPKYPNKILKHNIIVPYIEKMALDLSSKLPNSNFSIAKPPNCDVEKCMEYRWSNGGMRPLLSFERSTILVKRPACNAQWHNRKTFFTKSPE